MATFRMQSVSSTSWNLFVTDTAKSPKEMALGELHRLRDADAITYRGKFRIGDDAWATKTIDAFWDWFIQQPNK
jgi:hypothetical protein